VHGHAHDSVTSACPVVIDAQATANGQTHQTPLTSAAPHCSPHHRQVTSIAMTYVIYCVPSTMVVDVHWVGAALADRAGWRLSRSKRACGSPQVEDWVAHLKLLGLVLPPLRFCYSYETIPIRPCGGSWYGSGLPAPEHVRAW